MIPQPNKPNNPAGADARGRDGGIQGGLGDLRAAGAGRLRRERAQGISAHQTVNRYRRQLVKSLH
jgi:hypothetical protein